MYPTVVMLLVETQRSMTDICDISALNASKLAAPVASEAHSPSLEHFSFAVEPIQSTTGDEAASRRSRALRSQDV